MEVYVAEKPTLAKVLANHLANGQKTNRKNGYIEGNGWIMTWCVGHLYELVDAGEYGPQWEGGWNIDSLPIIPSQFKYKPSEKTKSQLDIVHSLCAKASRVYNCGDPDKEGQFLVDLVIDKSSFRGEVLRVWPDDLSPNGLNKVFSKIKPNSQYRNLSDSARCRGIADWMVGINFTRLFTCMAQKQGHQGVISIGRVQTVVYAMVYERCKAIEKFRVTQHYGMRAKFSFNGQEYFGDWQIPENLKNEDGYCMERGIVEGIAKSIGNSQGFVAEADKKNKKENAPLPFSLSSMQIFASKKWGYSAKQVLNACQFLYETLTATTYPRTDCNYLSEGDFGSASKVIQVATKSLKIQADSLELNTRSMPRCYNDTKTTAHTAIIPTDIAPDFSKYDQLSSSEKTKAGLGANGKDVLMNIYSAIATRFIIQFLPAHEFLETIIFTSVKNHIFKSTGKVIVSNGWKAMYSNAEAEEDAATSDENGLPILDSALPDLNEGDTIHALSARLLNRKTTPPDFYTEGTLIEAMLNIARLVDDPEIKKKLRETDGIGTEASRADMLDKIKKIGYVVEDGSKIKITELGSRIYPSIPTFFKNPTMTAVWETALGSVSEGKASPDTFIQNIQNWTSKQVMRLKNSAPDMNVGVEAKYHCLKCNSPLFRRKGKFGDYWGCSGNTCKETYRDFKHEPLFPDSREDETCKSCKKGVLKTKVMYGDKVKGTLDRKFLGCSDYPTCKNIEWLN